jgi:hypothetical protein
MEVTPLAPPSVQLVPAKEYSGAPIGTSYDVRAYAGTLCLLNDTLSRHRLYYNANKPAFLLPRIHHSRSSVLSTCLTWTHSYTAIGQHKKVKLSLSTP